MVLDTRFPAGMTIPAQFVYYDERASWAFPANLNKVPERQFSLQVV
jgi:hypothetical protein